MGTFDGDLASRSYDYLFNALYTTTAKAFS